jgi:adenylate kinase
MQPQTFVFFGQVGSGKGTQVKLLADFLRERSGREVICAGTGEGFRKFVGSGNYLAKLVQEKMEKGELQPDFLTTTIFMNLLADSLEPEKHLIADGYPRTIRQSEDFESAMKFFDREKIKIIYLELSEEEAVKRNLLRGRVDDTEESLKQRLDEYKNNVVPAMNYFKEKEGYEILVINGEQTIEKVHEEIINKLGYSD